MARLSKPYLFAVLSLTLILPVLSVFVEGLMNRNQSVSLSLIGKWFIFWAVGVRLLAAGLRQVVNPSFTARDIFEIEHEPSHAIVRELGFANICAGLVGVISLFLLPWRVVSAFGSGLFYGLAGINHLAKKPASPNEAIALVSDIFIFLVLLIYVLRMF